MNIKNLVEVNMFPGPFPVRVINNTDKAFTYPSHWHKAIEIVVAAKKRSKIIINNKKYDLEQGDIVFISGGDIHSYPLSPGSERIIIIFDLHTINGGNIFNEDFPYLTKSILIKKHTNNNLHFHIYKHIERMLNEVANVEPGSRFALLARIYDILSVIVKETEGKVTLVSTFRKDLLYKVGQIAQYIENNYMEEITLGQTADRFGFSEHYLSRLFKSVFDTPFRQYLNEIRIKHAEESIVLNKENISNIAYNCGFNSLSTFNRTFREIKGCSPSQYRKMQLNHIAREDDKSNGM
ncbi:MAG TPA: AraC family transcriptional regulator [Thermoclostridium sp.]|nr:AraC family transcriptional regulator [Thermoclostridium sp.]